MEIRRVGPEEVWDLRHRVLRNGQARALAMWPGDDSALHWALIDGEERCAVLSIFPTPQGPAPWQLRGMAVAPERQRQGLGLSLLLAVEQWMFHEYPGQSIWCNARTSAVDFYERAGWSRVGEPFEIAGVGPHLRMRREAAP